MDYTWIITAISIIGVVANIYKKRWCFGVWLVTNTSWMLIDFYAGLYAQSVLFAVYVVLAAWGLMQWRKG